MRPTSSLAAAAPRVIAWESTVACNLSCVHCRADAQLEPARDELSTREVEALIDDIAAHYTPVLIISGGEPLLREDIYHLATYAGAKGLRVAMAPNGTLIDGAVAERLVAAGLSRISVSIDGSSAERHDAIRGVPGAYAGALEGLAACRSASLAYQLNTTVMRQNLADLPAMQRLAVQLGAAAWHVFMLVPTGRGQAGDEVTPEEYEQTLEWIYETTRTSPVPIRVTCGPHYVRITASHRRREGAATGSGHPPTTAQVGHGHGRGGHPGGLDQTTRGCLAGNGYCFISYRGAVQPCGYLPLQAGSIRERPFHEIYERSDLFLALRDLARLEGKCGACEYARTCGGCRARAYSATGNYLGEEPYCTYRPRARRGEPDAR